MTDQGNIPEVSPTPSAVLEHAVHGLLVARAAQDSGAVAKGVQQLCARIDDRFATTSPAAAPHPSHPLTSSVPAADQELDLQWRLIAQAVADGEADAASLATWRDKCAHHPQAASFAHSLQLRKQWTTTPRHQSPCQSAMLETVLMSLQPIARPAPSWSLPAWIVLALAMLLSLVVITALSLSGSLNGLHIALLVAHALVLTLVFIMVAWVSLRSICVENRDFYSRLLTWRLRPVPCVTMWAMAIIMPAGLLVVGW